MANTLSPLNAISPIDGRYQSKTDSLSPYFSEFGLIKYRVIIEIEYLIALSESKTTPLDFNADQQSALRSVVKDFSEVDALRIKEIEKITNHDVKAVEYFIKEQLAEVLKPNEIEYIHFGLTSQDINNSAVPLSIKDAKEEIIIPMLRKLIGQIEMMASNWKDIPMLAKTHGQPASPTKLGKEFLVFSERLHKQVNKLEKQQLEAKFGGATGNLNAHYIAYPDVDWVTFANNYIESLGMIRQQTTTQIEQYDELASLFNTIARICTILIDYARDIWIYVSMDYFKQKLKEGEIGSSAMPHKVNPIDFENAEGNLGIAIAILNHLADKLPVSRLQRDLTDSTVLRNIGVPFGHLLIAVNSILKGNDKLLLNESAIHADLEKNWIVVAEAIQSVLRTAGFEKPYELLKDLTRTNKVIGKAEIHEFIRNLDVSDVIKDRLLMISPQNYTGNA
jgi:adenylosuccinate lyase